MALRESIGIRPGTPTDIADVSQEPMPPGLEESVGCPRRLLLRLQDLG